MKLRRIKKAQESPNIGRKRKKRAKRILRWIKLLLFVGVIAAAVIYAAVSPVFDVKTIDAGQTIHYDGKMLISLTGIKAGDNGFRLLFKDPGRFYLLRAKYAERAILAGCPYAKNAVVRFSIPDKIKIAVTERKPAAVLETSGKSFLIDKEGYLLEVAAGYKKQKLPVIRGMKLASFKPGKKLALNQEAFSTASKLYATIRSTDAKEEDKLFPMLDYVDVSDQYNTVFSLQSRIIVNLGSLEDLNYKLNAVRTVLSKNIRKDERGKLDFSVDKNPVCTPENGG
jgi:cell division protein FtsQ